MELPLLRISSFILTVPIIYFSWEANVCAERNWAAGTPSEGRYKRPFEVINYSTILFKPYNGICTASCFSKDTPAAWLRWKSRLRTDISRLLSHLEWYFQNYSRRHYFPYFTCVIFVFYISATEQWRVKHAASNVTADFKSFIFTSVPHVNLLPLSLETCPHVHTNACNLVWYRVFTSLGFAYGPRTQQTAIVNLPPCREHGKIYSELK